MVGRLYDQQQAQRKQGSKNDPHRRAFIHLAETADPLGENRGQNPHHGSTDKHGQTGTRASNQKGNRQARQYGMTDRIPHHTHLAEHQKIAQQRTGNRCQNADDHDPCVYAIPFHCVAQSVRVNVIKNALLMSDFRLLMQAQSPGVIGCGLAGTSSASALLSLTSLASSKATSFSPRTCSTASASRSTRLVATSAYSIRYNSHRR